MAFRYFTLSAIVGHRYPCRLRFYVASHTLTTMGRGSSAREFGGLFYLFVRYPQNYHISHGNTYLGLARIFGLARPPIPRQQF